MLIKCKLPLAMLMSMVLSILSPQLSATDFSSNNLKLNKIFTSGFAIHSDTACYPLANCQATMLPIMGLSSLIQPSHMQVNAQGIVDSHRGGWCWISIGA